MGYTSKELKVIAHKLPTHFFRDAFAVSGHLKINLYLVQLGQDAYKMTIALLVELERDHNHPIWESLFERDFEPAEILTNSAVYQPISWKERYLRFAGMQVIDELIKFKKDRNHKKNLSELRGISDEDNNSFKIKMKQIEYFSNEDVRSKFIHIRSFTDACEKKLNTIVQILAHDKVRDTHGGTVFQLAAMNGSLYMVFLLLSAGANMNAVDSSKNNALILAVQAAHCHIVKILLANGANFEQINARDFSPLKMAKRSCDMSFFIQKQHRYWRAIVGMIEAHMRTPSQALLLGNDVVDNTKMPSFFSYVTGAARSSSSSSENSASNSNNNNNNAHFNSNRNNQS